MAKYPGAWPTGTSSSTHRQGELVVRDVAQQVCIQAEISAAVPLHRGPVIPGGDWHRGSRTVLRAPTAESRSSH